MAPRQRKKGHKQDVTPTDAPNNQQQAARKKVPKTRSNKSKKFSKKLYLCGSILAGIAAFGWLFIYAANLGGGFMWMDGATRNFLESFVCEDRNGGFCNAGVVPHRRTQKAKQLIHPGERVLVVPRHLQIWDLDALRDDFVREKLASARHVHTNNPLHSGAFLAAYLARRVYQNVTADDPMRPYFDILPTFKTLEPFHPAVWSEKRLSSLLEPHSWSHVIARGYQDMLRSEYSAFATESFEFASQVTVEQYMTMRVNVMSRSFGAGPPKEEEALPNQSLTAELEMYQEKMGVNLTKGCHAMVPILDMYDHHPVPNVGWKYDSSERAFVIKAVVPIPPGQDIMDSYGKYTDAHLFSKFGFVNGDGSGYTEVSIAALHKPLDIGMREQFSYVPFSGVRDEKLEKHQKQLLSRYLVFDDGYSDCIQKELHPEAFELKKLKLEHLNRIANDPKRWILQMPPRTDKSVPSKSTDVPITYNPPDFHVENLNLDASKIIGTCRLISLSNDDFDGNATQVLKEALNSDEPFFIDNQGDGLEYRALACLSRLTGISRWRYKQDLDAELALVRELTYEAFQSRMWTAAQVRLGEIQTLEVLHRVAISGVMEMTNRIQKEANSDSLDVLPHIHEQPCPVEYTDALLAEK